jgi:hypothetical protein
MNERIQELAEQANIKFWVSSIDPRFWGEKEEYLEKFAELIVKECADIADINAHQYETPGSYVKQHFGVK